MPKSFRARSGVTQHLKHTMKTVTLTKSDLIPTFNALSNLGKIQGLIALKVARVLAAMKPHARELEIAHRNLSEAYKGPNGGIAPEKREAYNTAEKELVSQTVELKVPLVTEAELETLARDAGFDPSQVAYLIPFVEAADGG